MAPKKVKIGHFFCHFFFGTGAHPRSTCIYLWEIYTQLSIYLKIRVWLVVIEAVSHIYTYIHTVDEVVVVVVTHSDEHCEKIAYKSSLREEEEVNSFFLFQSCWPICGTRFRRRPFCARRRYKRRRRGVRYHRLCPRMWRHLDLSSRREIFRNRCRILDSTI